MYNGLVEILLATYNGQDYIEKQIQSIIHQTYTNWNLLVSDDCSNDKTLDILYKYAKEDSRIKIISKGKRFGSAAKNFIFLLKNAQSEFVAFCDQDDYWHPDKLEVFLHNVIDAGGRENGPMLIYSDLRVVDQHGVLISESYYDMMKLNPYRNSLSNLLVQNIVTGCASMINRDLYRLILKHTIDCDKIVMHDWFIAVICAACGSLVYIDSPTIDYCQHITNVVGAKKFNLLKWIKKNDDNKVSIRNSVIQASYIYDNYKLYLSDESKKVLKNYASILSYSLIKRLFILIHYDLWKSNVLRRIGQIIYTLKV
ncbi:Glycosyl transferase family 2 [Bifidobacterium hapali]|uniref:Glycosyl transferase family 2 n=1 Tax=Bifidobacterium hapali TaxID=1630172 RepID=A0A261G1T4_9BIFI|nr:glycosyltransferase family 2 protein [Bifidobacterium hapali]OZG65391.1 Glycosyl transferase family 2 [Bifidobacterium hapali]